MQILTSLKTLLLSLPLGGRATLEAIVESIRSLFGGDLDTRRGVAFSVAIIALSAKMAKADGVVTTDEVAAFQQILTIPPDEMRNVFRLYDLAKQDMAGFEAYAARLTGLCEDEDGNHLLLGDVLDGLFHISKADGIVHERELALLERVAGIFGLTDREFERIRHRHVRGGDSPYVVLGIDPDTPKAELRRRYLDLVRENHPDRLIARGMPDEFMFIATERMKAINAAYAMLHERATL